MAGRPLRKTTDNERFKEDYLDSLRLRDNLDDMTLKAVQVYKKTGLLPPQSQMIDSRTPSEKLKDTIGLKKLIIDEVGKLSTQQFAQMVVDQIDKSPLNQDNSLLTFVAQRIPEVGRKLKESYALGIKGDINDAIQFVKLQEDMYRKTKLGFSTVSSYFNRPYSDNQTGIKPEQFNNLFTSYMDLINSSLVFQRIPELFESSNAIYNKLIVLRNFINNGSLELIKNKREEMEQFFDNNGQYLRAVQSVPGIDINPSEVYLSLNELFENFPNFNTLITMIGQIKSKIRENNFDSANAILLKIFEQLPDTQVIIDMSLTIDRLFETMKEIVLEYNNSFGQPPSGLEEFIEYVDPDEQYETPYASPNASISQTLQFQDESNQGSIDEQTIPIVNNFINFEELENYIMENYENRDDALQEVYEILVTRFSELTDDERENVLMRWNQTIGPMMNRTIDINNPQRFNILINNIVNYFNNFRDIETDNTGFIGLGFKKQFEKIKRPIGRPPGRKPKIPFEQNIAINEGIKSGPRFIPFGKYVLDKNKLSQDVITLKTMKGTSILSHPTKKVSRKLGDIFRKMSGGMIPTFDDMNALDEEEKKYLHSVSKKSNLLDKISVPTPDKDTKEQDLHQFEVMKGQIMAGNDNKDFIKKFKLLLMRLQKSGELPKREVSEILGDLAELGF